MLAFVLKILGYTIVLNMIILSILWTLKILHLFTLILIYEALFVSIIGVFQILCSYIYKEDRYPRHKSIVEWFDFRKFAKLKPEERQRYRQEGKIMIIIGLLIVVAAIIVYSSIVY